MHLKTEVFVYMEVCLYKKYNRNKDVLINSFWNENGRILTLRTYGYDCSNCVFVASKFKDSKPPFRYRYTSNVFKVRQKFAGKRSEVTDCGIELIGLDSKSDVQVLSLRFRSHEKL